MRDLADAFYSTFGAAVADIHDPCPYVFASAGVDSTALLLALVEHGREPVVVSFMLDGRLSRDFSAARRNARLLGLPFMPVILPADTATVLADLRGMIRDGVRGKANLECTWPVSRAIAAAAADGARTIVTGTGADAFFGLSRDAMVNHRATVELLDAWRTARYLNPNLGQADTLRRIAAGLGVVYRTPYTDRRVRDVFTGTSWDQVNRPRQKEPIRRAFLDAYPDIVVDRAHVNLQLGDSGIAARFAQLLDDPQVNRAGHRAVNGLYNELAGQHG